MLGKTTRPVVTGKLLKPEFSGHRALFAEEITSPKSPLDFKIRSPRGMKNCDATGGVGLGILAALEKSGGGGRSEIQMKFIAGNLNLNRESATATATATVTATATATATVTATATGTSISVPIPIGNRNGREIVTDEEEDSESNTYVTLHKPNNQSYTRVYCDHGGDRVSKVVVKDDDGGKMRMTMGVFCESPPGVSESEFVFPASDFLSSCFLCRKNLHGKDIFMYRGEKAFCSSECRHRQIVSDERQEKKCRSEASKYRDVSISPYSGGGQLFSAGITAS